MKKLAQIKIESILIFFTILTFAFSLFLKIKSEKYFLTMREQLIFLYSDQTELGKTVSIEELKKIYQPITYFNENFDNQLSNIIKLKSSDSKDNELFLREISSFQNTLEKNIIELKFGYDCLLFSSLFLLFVIISIIILKYRNQKNELLRLESINNAEKKMRQDLHDGLAQDLFALKLFIQNDDKEKVQYYANQAFNEVRFLIDSNQFDVDEDFAVTLNKTLKLFENNFSIKTEFLNGASDFNKINTDTRLELLKILHETLSNVAKHSKATLVQLKTFYVGDKFNFIIKDNGVGFSKEEISKDKNNDRVHHGLNNITERISSLGGTVDFDTTGGTTIAIKI